MELEDLFNSVISADPFTKICSKCGRNKELKLFNWASKTKADKQNNTRRLKAQCKSCDSLEFQVWANSCKEDLQEKDRTRYYKKKYGLEEDLAKILSNAENRIGRCPICKQKTVLVLDHCHDSGEVRDLICGTCNSLLGYSKESLNTLYGAIMYIKKHKGL